MIENTLIQLQVFYEIAMAVGNGLDLNAMLKSSLKPYLKKLSCSGGIIYRTVQTGSGDWQSVSQCAIPRNAAKKEITSNGAPIIPLEMTDQALTAYSSSLPKSGKSDDGRVFHVMPLAGFGLIVIFKSGDPFDSSILQSLENINKKIGDSALVCLQNEKIETINRRLSREIAIRKTAEKAKNQFLANMSHELLTPMNGILGINKMLCDSGLTSKQAELSNTLNDAARALSKILKNLFEFSKIEMGQSEPEETNFNIRQFITTLINSIKFKADKKGLVLKSMIDPQIPEMLHGDAGRISQMLTHLIDNSIKFTPAGEICVGAVLNETVKKQDSEPLEIAFSVQDSGIGIPDPDKKTLFKKFIQADNSDSRKYGGIGLGLAICKKISEMLNATIDVTDNPAGGTVITVTLPLAQFRQTPVKPKQQISETVPARIHVLVVDDNPVNRKIIEGICKKLGWYAQSVNDGSQAVDILASKEFDLVLMDCQMPVMDGYDASKIIRDPDSDVLDHDVPVVAVTANITDENREKCIKAGMNDFIAKPVSPEKIKSVLNRRFFIPH